MMDSLWQSINKISQIDRQVSQSSKKQQENKFIDNIKSMMTSLSQPINKISEIDKKYHKSIKKN